MPLSPDEWRKAAASVPADQLAITAMMTGLPESWWSMAPGTLIQEASIIAMHYDRHRMAEALRNRILNETAELPPQDASLPPEVEEGFRWMAGKFEEALFTLADQIEKGEVGLAH